MAKPISHEDLMSMTRKAGFANPWHFQAAVKAGDERAVTVWRAYCREVDTLDRMLRTPAKRGR